MEFSSRNVHKPAPRPTAAAPVARPTELASAPGSKYSNNKALKILGVILFLSAVILAVAAIASIAFRSNETVYVDENNYQVVTLADKQAYFGKITEITDDYIVLKDIYYIQGTSDQGSDTATGTMLAKRGCEIHKPQDQMIIRQNQVDFWENLQSDGKIAKGIAEFKQANPKGIDCDKQQAAAEQTTDNATSTDAAADKDKATTTTTPQSTTTDKTTEESAN